MILSKVIALTDDENDENDNKQTDTCVKTVFSQSGGLKTWRFDENWGGQILHKSNTFSDENVKMSVLVPRAKNFDFFHKIFCKRIAQLSSLKIQDGSDYFGDIPNFKN